MWDYCALTLVEAPVAVIGLDRQYPASGIWHAAASVNAFFPKLLSREDQEQFTFIW